MSSPNIPKNSTQPFAEHETAGRTMPICDHSSECEHEINTPHGVAYNGDVACKYEDVLSVVMQMAMKDAEEQGTVIESMKVHDLSLFVEEDEEEEMGIDTDSEKDNVDEEEDDTTSDEDSDEEEDTDNDDSVTSEPKDVVPENSDTDDDDDDAIVETTEVSIAVAAIKASDHAIPEDSSSEDEADTDDVVPGEDSSSKEDYSPKGIADSTISRSSSHSSLRSTISCDTAYILEHYDAFRKTVSLMDKISKFRSRRQDKNSLKKMSKDEEKEGKRPCKELNKPQSKDMNESDITPASNNMRGKKTRMSKRLQMPERVNSFADSMKKNVHDKEKQEKVKQKLQAGLNVAKDIAIEEATNLVMKDPRVRAAKFVVGVAVEQIKKQKKK